jgi:hypothetical protein
MKVVRRHGAFLAAFVCLVLLPSLALAVALPCHDAPGQVHQAACTCVCHTPCLNADPGLTSLSPMVSLHDVAVVPPALRLFAHDIFQPPRA